MPATGIEPVRILLRRILSPVRLPVPPRRRMDGGGFEPPKQDAADLQSVPFGHSGNYPNRYESVGWMRKHFLEACLQKNVYVFSRAFAKQMVARRSQTFEIHAFSCK